jgi:hypothetical protein
MRCAKWRDSLIEFTRGRLFDVNERNRVAAHVKVCPDCAIFLDQQIALTAAAAQLAAETPEGPPADLESVLVARFVSNRSPRLSPMFAAAIGAIAAALALVAVTHRSHVTPVLVSPQSVAAVPAVTQAPDSPTPKPVVNNALKNVVRRRSPALAAAPAPFVAIPYTLPLDPRERATVMRMEMPIAALTAVGFPLAAPDPEASAQADVVVGEDGRIRAIRLLSISDSNSNPSRRMTQ